MNLVKIDSSKLVLTFHVAADIGPLWNSKAQSPDDIEVHTQTNWPRLDCTPSAEPTANKHMRFRLCPKFSAEQIDRCNPSIIRIYDIYIWHLDNLSWKNCFCKNHLSVCHAECRNSQTEWVPIYKHTRK